MYESQMSVNKYLLTEDNHDTIDITNMIRNNILAGDLYSSERGKIDNILNVRIVRYLHNKQLLDSTNKTLIIEYSINNSKKYEYVTKIQ